MQLLTKRNDTNPLLCSVGAIQAVYAVGAHHTSLHTHTPRRSTG